MVPFSASASRLGHKSLVAPTRNGGVVGTLIGLTLLSLYCSIKNSFNFSGVVFFRLSSNSFNLNSLKGPSKVSSTYISTVAKNLSLLITFFLESLVRSRIFH